MYDISFFKETLGWIKDPALRQLTRIALEDAPRWFWTAPSSSSGKYHPVDSNGEGGLCRHTVKVIWIASKLAECFDIDSDMLVVPAHLHDWAKFGTAAEMETGKERPQYHRHAELGSECLARYFDTWCERITVPFDKEELRSKWGVICGIIASHMGKWGNVPCDIFVSRILHIADVIAALPRLVAAEFMQVPENHDKCHDIVMPTSQETNGQAKKSMTEDNDKATDQPGESSEKGSGQTSEPDKTVLIITKRELGRSSPIKIINFGKYTGMTIQQIVQKDPDYVRRVLEREGCPEEVRAAFVEAML